MSQFGRALSELGIEILCANTSQAKDRVERMNRTLRDRLVKELRLEGIGTINSANAYLPAFVARFNERFAMFRCGQRTCTARWNACQPRSIRSWRGANSAMSRNRRRFPMTASGSSWTRRR